MDSSAVERIALIALVAAFFFGFGVFWFFFVTALERARREKLQS